MSITLGEIEQDVCRRCGPYETYQASGGTVGSVDVLDLVSSLDTGEYEDRWLLRRSAAYPSDRQRRVAAYTNATGTLTVDRAWTSAPTLGEVVELLVLDPTQQLRVAALAGLRRCYFVDRVEVTPTGVGIENDLTAALFWIEDVGQIHDIQYRVGSALLRPGGAGWYRVFHTSAGVQAAVGTLMSGTLIVTALRPHLSWVNGADSLTGPTDDSDTLDVSLDYVAAAGHIEAWRRCMPTLTPVATGGMAISRTAAKEEFEAQVNRHVPMRPDRLSFHYPFGSRSGGLWDVVTPSGTWARVAATYTWSGLSALTWRQVLGI